MDLYVMDVVFWMIFGTRGDVPRDGDFPARPDRSPLASSASRLMRVLAAVIMAIAFLSLVLWAGVWLAIRSL